MGDELEASTLVYQDDHVDPPFSHILTLPVLLLGYAFFALALREHFREKRRAKEADEAFDPSAPLMEGSRYVGGTVELAERAERAIKVEIHQVGTEQRVKNGWSHRYTEVDRTITAEPFYLRRDDGRRVRVEPGVRPLLVDAVDQMVWTDKENRTRIAELTAGEHAICEGVLVRDVDPEDKGSAQGYRDAAGRGWVMRAKPGETLHVSTEGLGERHRIRAKRYLRTSFFVLAMGMVALGFASTYVLRAALGVQGIAEVTDHRHYTTTDSKGRTHSHWVIDVDVTLPDGRIYSTDEELDSSDWSRVGIGARLPYRYVSAMPIASAPGRGSSIHLGAWALTLLLTFFAFGGYAAERGFRRWYEGKVVDAGSGRLPDPPPPWRT